MDYDQYTMFKVKYLEDNIFYWENVLSYPEFLINFINETNNNSELQNTIGLWESWRASDDNSTCYGEVKSVFDNIKNTDTENNQKCLYIINSIKMAFKMCMSQYMQAKKININDYIINMNHFYIRKWSYEKNAYMGKHFDGQDGDSTLAFSMVLYLNDDYEGGEISFPNQNITIKPKSGSLIMFPSQMPYIHEVLPFKNKDRYTVSINLNLR